MEDNKLTKEQELAIEQEKILLGRISKVTDELNKLLRENKLTLKVTHEIVIVPIK